MDDDASSSDSESYAGSAASIAAIQDSAEHRVTEQIVRAYDILPLDRALVVQAQLSGMLHAQLKELQDLESQASKRVPEIREISHKSKDLIKAISSNVDWLKAHMKHLVDDVRDSHPIEYAETSHNIKRT